MKPPVGSRTALVLDALFALLADGSDADDYPFKDVLILDGPHAGQDLPDDRIMVGGNGDPASPAVVVNRTPQPNLGHHAYLEATEVAVVISTYSGDTDLTARRARGVELYDAIKTRLDANRVLDGVWDSVELGDQEAWYPTQAPAGCTLVIGFTILAEAVL